MTNDTAGASNALSLFRFSLALTVMAEHLSSLEPAQTGRLAVEAFFCISGFLITMVARGPYEGRPVAFLSNRFLRIFPTYWACLAIGLAIVTFIPGSTGLHPSLRLPNSLHDWLANFAVFGLTQETWSRVLPAAWSLHTELWFYLVIGLITATRPRATLFMLGVTLAVSAYCAFWWGPVPFYGTPIGNAHAFFIGSAVFLLRERLRPRRPLALALAGLAAFELLAWGPFLGEQTVNEFLGAPVVGLFLLGLWNARLPAFAKFKAASSFAGRLSYPLFLIHWPAGALAIALIGGAPGLAVFAAAGALSLAGSVLVVWLVEEPLKHLRALIRSRAQPRILAPALAD